MIFKLVNPFVPNSPFLYSLRTSEKRKVEKGCIKNEWVNSDVVDAEFSANSVISLINPIFSQCTLFLPPENIRKPYGFLMFSGGRESVHWEQMG